MTIYWYTAIALVTVAFCFGYMFGAFMANATRDDRE